MVLNSFFLGHPLCKPCIMKSHFYPLDFTQNLLIHMTSILILFLCLLQFCFPSLSSLKLDRSLLHRDALLEGRLSFLCKVFRALMRRRRLWVRRSWFFRLWLSRLWAGAYYWRNLVGFESFQEFSRV